MTLDPDSCTGVEDALLARLEKRSSNVKLKTLRLIKMLCESGSPSFRRDLQRRIKEVRECLHWQGEPHPTMGDLPNKMVRETAQQVINLIIDTAPHAAAPPSGLGLTPAPAPASTAPKPEPAPSMPSAQSQPQLQPLPLPQQSISSASGTPSKYTGFGSDNSSRSGPDHKPLATYFTNAPAPAPASASVHVLGWFGKHWVRDEQHGYVKARQYLFHAFGRHHQYGQQDCYIGHGQKTFRHSAHARWRQLHGPRSYERRRCQHEHEYCTCRNEHHCL